MRAAYAVVRQRTTGAIAMMHDRRDAVISCRVPREIKEQIHEYRSKNHIRTETDSIVQLLRIGIFVENKREELKDPEVVEFLKAHLYDQQLVDWIFQLDDNRLAALYGAFRDARELRFNRKRTQ
jgi:hypothetical protein